MSKPIFYINGEFLPEDEAKVSVLDLGLLRGYGVFELLRTYSGKPFRLKEHLERLKNSADQIGLRLPKSPEEIAKVVDELLVQNRFHEANIKIILTGGVSPDQITPLGTPSLFVLAYPATSYPAEFYTEGVKVVTVRIERFLATSKTINYIPAILALSQARKQEAVEALYVNKKGEVLEGTTSNFFVFKNKILITPKEGILLGISRQVVLELAKKEYKVTLRPIKYEELGSIDEAFLTASNKEVMPVVRIDDMVVGSGKPGQNTQRVMEMFRIYTRGE
ncbi:MAG: aminotransferase class IV [Chloroflexi bacterium]|nr:aminotransferase class IV [Chloroflexota bacterium]